MLRTLIDCSRLMLESPWLILLGFIVLVVPGGLLLAPVLAAKLRRAKAAASTNGSAMNLNLNLNPNLDPNLNPNLAEPIAVRRVGDTPGGRAEHGRTDFNAFVPAGRK